jgi:hypothetical protein
VDFQDKPLSEVVRFFRDTSKMNFVISGAAEDASRKPVTFRAKDVRPFAALSMMLSEQGLRLSSDHGALVVADKHRAYRTSAYESVADLVVSPFVSPYEPFGPEDLVQEIRDTIAHASWDEEGCGVSVYGGILTVRNTPENIKQVKSHLVDLRSRAPALVAVEVELVTLQAAQARQHLRQADHMLSEEEAAALARQGAVERVTLRGFPGHPLSAQWSARRSAKGERREVSSTIEVTIASERADLKLRNEYFTDANGLEKGGGEVLTSVPVPRGRVTWIELPESGGKARVILLRVR